MDAVGDREMTMPTLLRVGPYRIFIFSGDQGEPPHVHVERDSCIAKIWLSPIRLSRNTGFPRPEVAHIIHIVREHEETLLRGWHEFFTD